MADGKGLFCGRLLFPAAYAMARGSQPVQEDAVALVGDFAGCGSAYFAIFDGNNGGDVAQYAANHVHRVFNKNYSSDVPIDSVLTESVGEVNNFVRAKWPTQGCASAIAIVIKDSIYVANCGDSKVVLIGGDGKIKQLSEDHVHEADGEKLLTRAFGAGALGISAAHSLARAKRENGAFLVLGSGGLWDGITPADAATIAKDSPNVNAAATAIKDAALAHGADDNVSVIVVSLTYK